MSLRANYLSVLVGFSCLMVSKACFAVGAFDPDALDEKTLSIVTPGYVGQPLSNNYLISESSAYIYVPSYNVETWSGDLKVFYINKQCKIQDPGMPIWPGSAATQLDKRHFSSGRNIVTTSEAGSGIPFRWNNLSETQRKFLKLPQVLNYVRGDRSLEGQTGGLGFRKRESVLGDIIRSTPLYWNEDGVETLFVGANDGMLHAFNAKTGEERFAFIPSQVIPKLKELKKFPYQHKFFVDGQLTALRFNPAKHGEFNDSVKSVMVGALGAGGRGLFALDIGSIPTTEAQAANHVLWEISNQTPGYENLGHVYGKSRIVRLNNGWPALVVGNGYNNTGSGKATLIFINPLTGQKMGEISTGAGDSKNPNGLSSVTTVDVDLDGLVDFAYAGDLEGNLWKFDMTSAGGVDGYKVEKLFRTKDNAAITMAPDIKRHPEGGRLVIFGTGRTFSFKDVTDKDKNFVYGIWDRPEEFKANDKLLEQKLKEKDYGPAKKGLSQFQRVRTISDNKPNWEAGKGNHYGWMLELDVSGSKGERVVGDGAFMRDNTFIFLTSNPGKNEDLVPQGSNWWMQINAMTGGEPTKARFDLNGDGKFTKADRVDNTFPAGVYIGRGTRSQFIALTAVSSDCFHAAYDGNSHKGIPGVDDKVEVVTVTDEIISKEIEEIRGVKGGHFDLDIYHGSSFSDSDTEKHVHEYDDDHNVTGLNLLAPSDSEFKLSGVISENTEFRVLVQNQYLSPAAEIHLDKPGYKANSRAGFIPLKLMNTSHDFKIEDAKLHTLKNIKSFAINLPVDAFTVRDWWGGHLGLAKDERVGLHPTETGCVTSGSNNYFQPVNPPPRKSAGQSHTGTGNGTSSSNSGVRHNGALTIQIVKDNVNDSQIEMVVPGAPEYGWQVKPALMSSLVYAEYTLFWHAKIGCYGESGWKKNPSTEGEDGGGKGGKDKGGSGGGGNPTVGDPNIQGVLDTIEEGVTVVKEGDTTIVTEIIKNANGTYTRRVTTTTLVENTETTVTPGNAPVSGVKAVDTIGVGGVVDENGQLGDELFAPSEKLGRVNWRELRR